MTLNPRTKVSRWQVLMSTPTDTVLTTAWTYYVVEWIFGDSCLRDFTMTVAWVLTYTGNCVKHFLFNWTSDLLVDKPCQLTYSMFKNWLLVAWTETLHTFAAAAKTSNISITRIVAVEPWDYFQMYAKSWTDNTTISVNSLFVTMFWES